MKYHYTNHAKGKWMAATLLVAILALLSASCGPAATPTATPAKAAPTAAATAAPPKAAPTAAATAAPPKAEATKPVASATTATAAKPSGAPIKVGVLIPLTGPLASLGFLQRISVKLAEADVNATGGINGSPLQLQIEDSPFDPKQAVTLVRKQGEQDKVFAIVGPYASAEFETVAPLSNDLKVVVASPWATKVGVAGQNRPYSFQLTTRDDAAEPPAIDAYKKLHPEVKNVVLTGDTKQSVTQYMITDVFPKLLKDKGLNVIGTVAFDTGVTDFSAIVTKIKDYKPDGLVVSTLVPEGVGLAKELERQAVKAPVVTSVHTTGGPIAQLAGTALEGWLMPSLLNFENPDPAVQSFVSRFFTAAAADDNIKPKPQHFSNEGNAYDAVMMISSIMRKAGIKPDSPLQQARDSVRDGLQNLKGYKGIVATTNMPASGEADWQTQVVLLVKNGKYTIYR